MKIAPFPSKRVNRRADVDAELGESWPERRLLWKRILDITCIVVALPLLIPLVVGTALLILIVSPGPILYLQERVGYRGRRFICIKFRTMKHKADDQAHREHLVDLIRSNRPMVKMENDTKGDARLIPLGGILRSAGLDELPQLLNVLGGQMSLVGPRPCLPYEWDTYLPEHQRRFDSWPGLTGLWQVCGKNRTTFAEMVALDIRYAKTQSLKLDLWIMMKTFPVLTVQAREALARRRAQPAARHITGVGGGTIFESSSGCSAVGALPMKDNGSLAATKRI